MKQITLIATFISILMVYTITIINGPRSRTCSNIGCYNLLAESILHKKTYLPIKVPEGLKNITFPYDENIVKQNLKREIIDLSLYKDKFYLYFGITPVLLLYIPYKIATNSYFDDYIALFFFSFGLVIFSFCFLNKFLSNHKIKTPDYFLAFSILLISLGNISIIQISNAFPHNIAILSASFCFLGGLFFLYNSLDCNSLKYFYRVLGGLLLGLSVGSRFSFIISSSILIIIFLIMLKSEKALLKNLLSLLTPYLLFISFLFYYNYIRFGHFLDFGFKYLINGNMMTGSAFSLNCFLPNCYFYFFYPPIINSSFPYLHNPEAELPKILYTTDMFFNEFLIGLVFNTPILLFLLFILFKYKNSLPKKEITILLVPSIINMLLLLFFRSAAIRYTYDYLNLLILLFLICYSYILNKEISKKRIFSFIFIVLSIISIYMGSLADRSLVLKKTGSRFTCIQ